MSTKIGGILALFVGLSLQQKDPLNDFCRRFAHQTAVIDDKLYIDGGFVDWNPISQNNRNYTNSWLLYNDLTTSVPGVGMPQLHANLSKNQSIPDVSGGALWADEVNKRWYLVGGEYNSAAPNTPSLLSYDTIYNQWENFGYLGGINSVAWGAGVSISDLGQGYMYGGWVSNVSDPGTSGPATAQSNLIKYEMDSGVWTNNTGPDDVPRAEGVMVHIPASSSGLLVYFGGLTAPYGNATTTDSPLNLIYVYDIASGKWYTQTASGQVPESRRRFCAGATWSGDKSSYNIYLYGGMGFGQNVSGYDDVYILSLPSFQWVKWWQGSAPVKPHNSLTCNVINMGQMLVIGGTFPLTGDCDSSPSWGTHNMDLGKLSGKSWNDFEPNITSYSVPPEIVAIVGGSSTGGATATQPSAGFNNSDLSVYFGQHAAAVSRSPTRAIPKSTGTGSSRILPTGAIAGIAVGGAIFILALTVGLCCFFRRHRKQKNVAKDPVYSSVPPQSPPPHNNHYNNSYMQEDQFHQPRYQLPTNSPQPPPPPVELSAGSRNDRPMHQVDPTKGIQVDESQHPVYSEWNLHHPSPILASPHPSTYSGVTELSGTHSQSNTYFSSQGSPVPTYSTTGRRPPPPNQPKNQTYYSP